MSDEASAGRVQSPPLPGSDLPRSGSRFALTELAAFTPPLLRPAAQGLAALLEGGPRGSALLVVPLLVALSAVYVAGELVEMRYQWGAGTASFEQTHLFAVQAIREQAETEVAHSSALRNLEEELRAVGSREAEVLSAIKHVQEGWHSPYAEVGRPNMVRYQANYDESKRRLDACRSTPGSCAEIVELRFVRKMDLYEMLFYAARGALRSHVSGFNSVDMPDKNEIR